MKSYQGFGSACVHATSEQSNVPSHMEPIYPTTTFSYDSPEELMEIFEGKREGYIYSRWNNPTFEAAQNKIVTLETLGLDVEAYAMLFASGMGAISSLFLATMQPGDKVIVQGNLYGGTNELLTKVLTPLGIEPIIMDLNEIELVDQVCSSIKSVKMIYIETPANPTIDCYDLQALCNIAKTHGRFSAVDNTFATPYLQQPFKWGADFIVHSTTKFLNGHGNAIGGILLAKDRYWMNSKLHEVMKLIGSNANPFDAWLLSTGIKTLELRMDRHCSNALQLAQMLESHQAVSKVNYCGLPSHRSYNVAKKQMSQFGGMLSFDLKGGIEAGKKFLSNLKLATLAVSLGTVDTIVQHPATMSHLKVDRNQRLKHGITDGLIRVSVGIENIEDLLNDFDQALK